MYSSMNKVWESQVRRLLSPNEVQYTTAPRGMKTYERIAQQLVIDMEQPVLTVRARKLGYKFMAAEAHWIMTGDNRVATIVPYSKEISQYSDDGVTYFGAYGPKFEQQIFHVVQTLTMDRDSRQAVINIWRESPPASKDIPCTLSLQWLIRNNALHCIATMRSSDIHKGLPYDVFNFSMLSQYVRLALKENGVSSVVMGSLTMQLGSSHLYANTVQNCHECIMDRFKSDAQLAPITSILNAYDVDTCSKLKLWLADLKDRENGVLAISTVQPPIYGMGGAGGFGTTVLG
jgi:thymidylate synthase